MPKPSSALYHSEVFRAGLELASLSLPPTQSFLEHAPKGNRHPVIVIPGFTANDRSTKLLRNYLRGLGYNVTGWRQGVNMGVRPAKIERVVQMIAKAVDRTGTKASLVGQSLGGIFGREIAKAFPELIEQVICLGSPFSDTSGGSSRVSKIYEYHNPDHLTKSEQFENENWDLPTPPTTPMTAVYSRWDGVCHWSACMQSQGHERCENVEVHSSHTGMGVNASVLYLVGDRLAQAGKEWTPFKAPRDLAWLYPTGDLFTEFTNT